MAKNKMSKWIIGAASVFAFTGFIGSLNQIDGTKESASGISNDKLDNATAYVENDPVKEEWMISHHHHDDDDYDENKKDFRNYINDENVQTSQQTKYRTRAS